MDKILQAGLAAGMSATSGFHSDTPNRPDPSLDGKHVLPQSYCPDARTRISIPTKAGPPIEVSPICIGAWPWGDKATWHWSDEELPAVAEAWMYLYSEGINFIDTAESYGHGKSEQIIGDLVRGLPRDSFVIQTKWTCLPISPNNLLHPSDAPYKSLQGSLKRLKLDYVDILLVHGPTHTQSIETVARGLAKCVDEGLARTVGVANYALDNFQEMRKQLAKYGNSLAINQCEYNVLRRRVEVDGDLSVYRELDVVFQSYSSLAQGRLSGKYDVEHPPPSTYRFSSYPMEDIQPTIEVIERIASKRGKSPASVAVNYNISKGALPLVGVRDPVQARDAVAALGWRLTEDEVKEIDYHSFVGGKTRIWQQG
ncbi:NADP-dependent oxidoreductase domain-containing protein [Xylariaceae sp. FL1272]|nr:NADP-dependent oxidoreductase domain-containing protein [Xylariaceae sp. FL1272]